MFQQVIAALSTREVRLPATRRNDAQVLRDEQQERWISVLNSVTVTLGGQPQFLLNAIEQLKNAIRQHQQSIFQFSHDDKGAGQLSGTFPILSIEAQQTLVDFARTSPYAALAAISEIGDRVQEFHQGSISAEVTQQLYHPGLLKFSAIYSSEKVCEDHPEVQKLAALVAQNSATLSTASQLSAELTRAVSESNNQWRAFLDDAHKQKDAAIAAFVEMKALESATETWRKKKTVHFWTFWIGITLLTLAVGSGLVGAYLNKSDIAAFVFQFKNSSGELPYAVILYSLIPLLAVSWILRIFGRLVTSALALGADAQLRLSLLETYLRLVKDASSGVDKTDRAVMLTALFRALPGQENDDVQPPSVLDLIKSKEK